MALNSCIATRRARKWPGVASSRTPRYSTFRAASWMCLTPGPVGCWRSRAQTSARYSGVYSNRWRKYTPDQSKNKVQQAKQTCSQSCSDAIGPTNEKMYSSTRGLTSRVQQSRFPSGLFTNRPSDRPSGSEAKQRLSQRRLVPVCWEGDICLCALEVIVFLDCLETCVWVCLCASIIAVVTLVLGMYYIDFDALCSLP